MPKLPKVEHKVRHKDMIWNPWHGCHKVSPGCEHCYMYYLDGEHEKSGADIHKNKTDFNLPLKKTKRGHWKIPSGKRLRVCMTSDFFLEEADEWRERAWSIMRARNDLTYFLLTKRPERIKDCLPPDWGDGWENVELNVSAENQEMADKRIPILLDIPAAKRGVLCAPILGPIYIRKYLMTGKIQQVSADGENYDGKRPCNIEWIVSLRNQCRDNNVNFEFFGIGNCFKFGTKSLELPKAYHVPFAEGLNLDWPCQNYPRTFQKKCWTCETRDKCNGCSDCGACPMDKWDFNEINKNVLRTLCYGEEF